MTIVIRRGLPVTTVPSSIVKQRKACSFHVLLYTGRYRWNLLPLLLLFCFLVNWLLVLLQFITQFWGEFVYWCVLISNTSVLVGSEVLLLQLVTLNCDYSNLCGSMIQLWIFSCTELSGILIVAHWHWWKVQQFLNGTMQHGRMTSFFVLLHLTCSFDIRFWCCSFKKHIDSEVTHKEEERRNLASALFGGIRASPKVLSESFLCGFVGCFTVKLCY